MSSWSIVVSSLVAVAGAVLSPERCAACSTRVPTLHAFCIGCARSLEPPPPEPHASHAAALAYGGAIAQAITAFKYGGRVELARPLGHVLCRALTPVRRDPPHVVVPVPLHPARLASRGFNQAALLAVAVARDLRIPLAPRALARLRDTPEQASLDRSGRFANVARAFAVRPAARIADRDVLVIDDVRTTGATLDACAHALYEAGARRVRTLVLARA